MVWPCHEERGRVNAERCNEVIDEGKEIKGQDYKTFSSISRCSTHNLCSEMTNFVLFSTVSLRFVLSRVCVFLYSLGPKRKTETKVAGQHQQPPERKEHITEVSPRNKMFRE